MPPSASAAAADAAIPVPESAIAWRKTAKPSWFGPLTKYLAVLILAFVLAQYVAGFIFLWSISADPRGASPLTLARYAYYYGDRAPVRHRLWFSLAVGFGGVVIAGVAALLPAGVHLGSRSGEAAVTKGRPRCSAERAPDRGRRRRVGLLPAATGRLAALTDAIAEVGVLVIGPGRPGKWAAEC